eukprot:CAMPEP_0180035708 /NCGR_PEP_ID=MMETSP0984-20121128/30449_1 /TAXON_ID=483367 /ORGANISM="non described non described, Strain CCMP 2436" /LENGTH=137 /DNA_ID=CAMNT_0021961657 /DNA_START=553 /DNA_END=963 /DNA_ORIENTATION=+
MAAIGRPLRGLAGRPDRSVLARDRASPVHKVGAAVCERRRLGDEPVGVVLAPLLALRGQAALRDATHPDARSALSLSSLWGRCRSAPVRLLCSGLCSPFGSLKNCPPRTTAAVAHSTSNPGRSFCVRGPGCQRLSVT